MNTHDIDIELPPLPPLYIAPSVEPVDYPQVAQALMDYAREAIEADRKRRGEPVAWIRKNGFRFIAEIEPQDDSEVPLYTAPQPAETGREVEK